MLNIKMAEHAYQDIASDICSKKDLGMKFTLIGKPNDIHDFVGTLLNLRVNKTVTYYASEYNSVISEPYVQDFLEIKESLVDVSESTENPIILVESLDQLLDNYDVNELAKNNTLVLIR
jgi:hypothetical protein